MSKVGDCSSECPFPIILSACNLVLGFRLAHVGVSVGAILSDYQRLRVESVCRRLGLISLGFLWRRDQSELLREMLANGVDATVIKVASMGLNPHKHLGKPLAAVEPLLLQLNQRFGVHP